MPEIQDSLPTTWEECHCHDAASRTRVAAIDPQQMLSSSVDSSAQTMERLFKKSDFHNLEIIGQFNQGFILCRLEKDLYIVDQHAADEIRNFERLQRETEWHRQPLIQPQTLHFSAAEEEVALANMDILRQNGFGLDYHEDRTCGQRLLLTAVPFSKKLSFSAADVQELVGKLMERPGVFCRPQSVDRVLASRACRGSIMIGTHLDRVQMTAVVRNLAGLDQPWNCPHSRPVIRHLCTLT